jgi:hypothetical protein
MGQPGFFNLDERYQRLSENGDPLVKLATLIDFEAFRPKLATALKRSDGSKGGRPPYDPVLMFKILILQQSADPVALQAAMQRRAGQVRDRGLQRVEAVVER